MGILNRVLLVVIATAVCLTFFRNPAFSCTSIVLMAEDGTPVYGRTMEWGAFDLKSRLVVIPRGYEFQGHTPDGKPGYRWHTKYGAVALDALEHDYMTDGINEKGLVVGLLYLPGFAEFQPYDPAEAAKSIGPLDLANYVLTNFANVDEVREGLEKIRVVPVPEPALDNIAAPIHLTVVEQSGKAIVVEYLDGKLKIFENPLRTMTNSPSFDWHMTNLRNYINLSPVAVPDKNIENKDFSPIGAGSGFLGMPGDYTPPSRFVRAVAYSQTARKTPDGPEAVYEVFRIMDNFNLPLGAAEGPDAKPEQLEGMRSATLWTAAADARNLKYYYHTQHNRRVRMIDLKKIDFSATDSGLIHFPLDKIKAEDIEEISIQ